MSWPSGFSWVGMSGRAGPRLTPDSWPSSPLPALRLRILSSAHIAHRTATWYELTFPLSLSKSYPSSSLVVLYPHLRGQVSRVHSSGLKSWLCSLRDVSSWANGLLFLNLSVFLCRRGILRYAPHSCEATNNLVLVKCKDNISWCWASS